MSPGATVTVSDLTFSQVFNVSYNQKAIVNQGNLTLQRVVANGGSGNFADIDNIGGTLAVDASTIMDAHLQNEGNGTTTIVSSTLDGSLDYGLVNTSGDVLLQNDYVYNNSTGGILNQGTLTVLASTIDSNGGSGQDGGIDTASGSATIINSTISNNTGNNLSGGISTGNYAVSITNCTTYGNLGPGIYSTGNVTLYNTIAARNDSGYYSHGTYFSNGVDDYDIVGSITSLGHNLIAAGNNGSGYRTSDLVGTTAVPLDPKLGPLQNNGGSTPTMALLPGSPALDAGGDANAPTTDQRGVARPQGTHVDIGAFELEVPPAPPPTPSPSPSPMPPPAVSPVPTSTSPVPTQVPQGLRDVLLIAESLLSGNSSIFLGAVQDYRPLLPAAQQEILQVLDTTLWQIVSSGQEPANRPFVDALLVTDGLLAGNPFLIAAGLLDFSSSLLV